MPISYETNIKIAALLKPCGNHKWQDDAVARAIEEIAEIEKPVILDAGCGADSWILHSVRKKRPDIHVLGFDVDEQCLQNKDIDEVKVASIYDIPFESESIDMAMSGYVLEHLDDPDTALQEIWRVLKPGAAFIAWAPNKLNPAMVVSSMTSHKFHVFVRRLVAGDENADNAPTYYKLSTVAAIKAAAKRHGFKLEYIDTYSSAYEYFRMTKITYFLACLANKIMPLWPFRHFRLTILFVLRKPEAE